METSDEYIDAMRDASRQQEHKQARDRWQARVDELQQGRARDEQDAETEN